MRSTLYLIIFLFTISFGSGCDYNRIKNNSKKVNNNLNNQYSHFYGTNINGDIYFLDTLYINKSTKVVFKTKVLNLNYTVKSGDTIFLLFKTDDNNRELCIKDSAIYQSIEFFRKNKKITEFTSKDLSNYSDTIIGLAESIEVYQVDKIDYLYLNISCYGVFYQIVFNAEGKVVWYGNFSRYKEYQNQSDPKSKFINPQKRKLKYSHSIGQKLII